MSTQNRVAMLFAGMIIAIVLGLVIGTGVSTRAPAQEVPGACETVAMFEASDARKAEGEKLLLIEFPENLVPMIKDALTKRIGVAPFKWDGIVMTKHVDNEGVIMVGFLNKGCFVHIIQGVEKDWMELIKEALDPKKDSV